MSFQCRNIDSVTRHLQLLRELYEICEYRHGNNTNATEMGLMPKTLSMCVVYVCVGCRIYKKPTWISFGLAFPYYILVCWPTVINKAATFTTAPHTQTHRYYKQKLYFYCGTYFGRISKQCVIQLDDE